MSIRRSFRLPILTISMFFFVYVFSVLILNLDAYVPYDLSRDNYYQFILISSSFIKDIGPFFLVILGIFFFLTNYLQFGFGKNDSVPDPAMWSDIERGSLTTVDGLRVKVDQMMSMLTELSERVAKTEHVADGVIGREKEELVERLTAEIVEKSNDISSEKIINDIERKIVWRKGYQESGILFRRVVSRLNLEIVALSRRGNVNLAIGVITSIVGIIALWYFVTDMYVLNGASSIGVDEIVSFNAVDVLIEFLPRFSFVVLIEIFAYFFSAFV